eukprot:scaffold267053_cov20-Tisochrysis_lutea.AAC.3
MQSEHDNICVGLYTTRRTPWGSMGARDLLGSGSIVHMPVCCGRGRLASHHPDGLSYPVTLALSWHSYPHFDAFAPSWQLR